MLPASGAITHSEITAEYGAPAATPMSSLYRGGSYVPNTSGNAGIPTSGAIAFSDFYGANGQHRLDTTVTTGTSGGVGTGYISGSLGSIANGVFLDGNLVSRTIERIQYNAPNLIFRLVGTGIGNNDQSFSSIVVNATTFNRSSAVYDGNAAGGTSSWTWNTGGGGNPWGTNPNNFDLFAVIP